MSVFNGRFGGVGRILLAGFVGALQLISHTVRAAHADDTATKPAEEPSPLQYQIAVGASLSYGDAGWGTELGRLLRVDGRYQLSHGLGIGASYFWLRAPNNEGSYSWPEFNAQALEGFATYHPFETSWIDPFARVGVLGLTRVDGIEQADRLGLEGAVGLDFVLPRFALGLEAQHGFTNRAWTMLGLHTEARF